MKLIFHPQLQQSSSWGLGIAKQFHPMLYLACDNLSMPELKLNHVSKRGPMEIGYSKRNRFTMYTIWTVVISASFKANLPQT